MTSLRAIALIGYRGTGKSTVGQRLASRLDWRFDDSDHHAEARLGMTIPEAFARLGEPAFRQAERDAIADLARNTNTVLATGGGAILHPENRLALRRFGLVVWLQAPPEILAQRIQHDPANARPALTAAGPLDEIAAVLAAREPLYRETCHLALDTTHLTPDQVVNTIHDHYRQLATNN
jgi:shikimate kinase